MIKFKPPLNQQLNQEQITNGKIRFQVEDTGLGIQAEQLNNIFLPFEQVGETSRMTEGTGLGLAISQKIAQLMDSNIQVESTPNQGSIFWIDLDLPQVEVFTNKETRYKNNIIGFKGEKRKVLVVDDKWANRAVMLGLLSPLGFHVMEAVDGLDCLTKALEFQPDCIFYGLSNAYDGWL
ncbi:MAG: hypothetical protein HC908_16400 [Calothrix sp. SM1_7_51]|nr:hypothetical protein [Calothrix sp. SM1_7_51]